MLPKALADVIERHDARRRARMAAWQADMRTAAAWRDGYERIAVAAATRTASVDIDAGGLEL